MPTVTKAPKPKAAKPQKAEPVEREVLYPDIVTSRYWTGEEGPITADLARQVLAWEDEDAYLARTGSALPTFLLKDEMGKKVQCWNSKGNRPYYDGTARKYAQDILNRKWSGPLTIPGGSVNGEAIIINRFGDVESGRHRLIGLVLAVQLWAKQSAHWSEFWTEEPVIESFVNKGISEDPRVLQTIDNVQARTDADVVYSLDVFGDLPEAGKKECSRMLSKATDLLWNRLGEAKSNPFNAYKSNSALADFRDRHAKLLKCVKHLFEENKNRAISFLKLSAGQCAALMYLMAATSSDGDAYRNADPPSEKKLKFDHREEAEKFWSYLSGGSLKAINVALAGLVDEETGTAGRQIEKFAVLALAWQQFLTGKDVEAEHLALSYATKDDGSRALLSVPDFGGADMGQEPEAADEDAEPTPEQVEADKARIRKEKAAASAAKVAAKRVTPDKPIPVPKDQGSLEDQLTAIKEEHPDKLLLFRTATGYGAWGGDALTLSNKLSIPRSQVSGMTSCKFPIAKLEEYLKRLIGAGLRVAICEQVEGETKVEESVAQPEPEANGGADPAAKPKRSPPKPKRK